MTTHKTLLSILSLLIMVTSCNQPLANFTTVDKFRLSYEGNQNTGGSVPPFVDAMAPGEKATVEGNPGNLVKEGTLFVSWNTKADRSGTTYVSGDSLTIVNANVTLYAQYDAVIVPPVIPPVIIPPGDGIPINLSLEASVEALITGNRYYIDPVAGLDTGTGSSASPWKTLAKAQSVARGGDGVMLRSGNYGRFSELAGGRTAYIVYRNDTGAVPVFAGINLDYCQGSGNSYLAFFGIKILPLWVVPGGNPQDPASTQTTYAKTEAPVYIRTANHVKILGCDIAGQSKYLTAAGVTVVSSTQVLVSGCVIHDVHRGIINTASQFLEYIGNDIHRIAGSAFMSSDAASNDILIEGNHAHDSNYDYADDYCPRALNANYHGSAVAIRGDRMTIRNNIFHDGFNSAGIMTYDQDNAASDVNYSDILIENNLLYDIRNVYVLRFYLISSNIVVRNNIFVGHRRATGTQYYDTAVNIDSVSAGADGSMLTFDNNIVVGITNFGAYWSSVKQHNNIFYSCRPGTGAFLSAADVGGNSIVATSVSTVTSYLFEQGFFNGVLRFDFDTSVSTNAVGHGQTLDFSLAPGSLALSFGDAARQSADGLGTLDTNGFIKNSSLLRSVAQHNAGAYP